MNANRTSAQRLLAQAGGVSGLVYSSLPVVTFVVASSAAGLLPAIGFALSMAGLILLWRLLRRESARPVVAGFCGVAVCALIAYLVGQSKGYFLLGIWMSLLWAVVFTLSILIRRPIVGYLWSWLSSAIAPGATCPALSLRLTSPPWVGRWFLLPGSSSKGTSTTPIRRVGWEWPGSGWVGR